MSLLQNSNAIESGGYNINNSLRFRASASAYLSRTPGSAGNRRTWTLSMWFKLGALPTADNNLYRSSSDAGANQIWVYFNSSNSNALNFGIRISSTNYQLQIAPIHRDPSAWYHLVYAVDTTQATSSNRAKIYINGEQVTNFISSSYPPQNSDTSTNNTGGHAFGSLVGGGGYFDGYMTEINFIDGQALTPSSFGATDATTGVWAPKAYSGTYGTNGFYLKFADASAATAAAIGKDSSGNGNNWTPNNISVTAGVTYDAMTDSPTLTSATVANYCTANPLDASPSGTSVLSNGNLTVNVSGSSAGGGYGGQARCNTINFTNVSGKWYWEAFIDNAGTGAATSRLTFFMDDEPVNISAQGGPWAWYWRADGLTDLTSPGSFATNDVVMFAYDSDTGKLWVGKNGTWSNSGVPASGTGQVKTLTALTAYALGLNYGTSGGGTGTASFNFGQRPFSYTPPTGFSRLNAYNLPDSTIKKGNSYMDATLWTGTGSGITVTNAGGFRPDFVWWKQRNGTRNHLLFDSVRGATKYLQSNTTIAEATEAQSLTSFNSNGFTLGTNSNGATNGETYVGWQWQAGSSTVTNTSGTISSQVRANTTTGFSIVTWTGTGSAATVGHGLGVAPKMVISKKRSDLSDWAVWITGFAGTELMELNSTAAKFTGTSVWNSTTPTSTVFSVGSATQTNNSGGTYVAYCWSEIAGFSKFGSYTGNGSTNGPFVYLGFRPKWIIIKPTNAIASWTIQDTTRSTSNVIDARLFSEEVSNEVTNGNGLVDYLSNGFKPRVNHVGINGSGNTYIYAAFAENPFKNSLAR